MAYEIGKVEESIDAPLSSFPTSIDVIPRMSDVSLTTLPLVVQYNSYYQAGNFVAAQQLVENNPDLAYCIFTAKGVNQLRDAITAVEHFLLSELEDFCNTVAKNAVGIEDNPTTEQMNQVAYSAKKVNALIEELKTLLLDTYSNVDNTADKDKSVKYAVSAGSAGSATTATTAEIAKTLEGVTVTASELNYTDGLTGNIQSQLNNKQKTVSGAVTTITDSNLTTNRALVSNGNGKVAVSAITSTELGYLDGVSSNIQTQLNNKAASDHSQAASKITAGTLGGKVVANASAVEILTDKQVRNIFANTVEVTAGSAFSGLGNGDIYLQHE